MEREDIIKEIKAVLEIDRLEEHETTNSVGYDITHFMDTVYRLEDKHGLFLDINFIQFHSKFFKTIKEVIDYIMNQTVLQ